MKILVAAVGLLVAGTILAAPATSYAQECEDPAVIDAARYALICSEPPPKNANQQALHNMEAGMSTGGCDSLAQAFGVAKTWTGLSSITEQQALARIDDIQPRQARAALANLPDNSAKEALLQMQTSANKATHIVTIVHSIVSFAPSTIQYDQNSGIYLCQAKTIYTPGSTIKQLVGEFTMIAIRSNAAAYIGKNDPQIREHIAKDAVALLLATNMMINITPNMCDVRTGQYTVQRIPSGKILVNVLSYQCAQ